MNLAFYDSHPLTQGALDHHKRQIQRISMSRWLPVTFQHGVLPDNGDEGVHGGADISTAHAAAVR